jgi:hypothetical protein
MKVDEEESRSRPARPARRKPFAVEGRATGSRILWRGLNEWHVWSRYRTRAQAAQAVRTLTQNWNGSVRPDGPVWEFRIVE